MARPTDPAKLAAYRARQAVNAANYRARLKAAKLGTPVPAQAVRKRAANYRPPMVRGAVERAQATAAQQRAERDALIGSLPDIRNPRVNFRPIERTERGLPERKSWRGRQRQAQAIRERSAAGRLQEVGRARKEQLVNELRSGSQSERLQSAMDSEQQRRFQYLSEKIAKGSQQSVALLFDYAGGQGDYSAAIEMIIGSPESRDVEEGLDRLERLAELAGKAASAYAPSTIGRLRV